MQVLLPMPTRRRRYFSCPGLGALASCSCSFRGAPLNLAASLKAAPELYSSGSHVACNHDDAANHLMAAMTFLEAALYADLRNSCASSLVSSTSWVKLHLDMYMVYTTHTQSCDGRTSCLIADDHWQRGKRHKA